ncbi:MAG: hypothetical protein AAGL99_02750 [Pseudomonadota bacterium]
MDLQQTDELANHLPGTCQTGVIFIGHILRDYLAANSVGLNARQFLG